MDLLRFLVLLSMKHFSLPGLSTFLGYLTTSLMPSPIFRRTFPGVVSQGAKKTLYHPAFTNDPLTQEVQTYAKWGLAWTTNRTYRSGENRFIQFCLSNRLMSQEGDILSASEGTLIYFASYLARTFKHSTIKRPCA